MLVIFYFSGRTSHQLNSFFPFIENLNPGHIAAYFVLGLLALYSSYRSNLKRPFLSALLLCSIYGTFDEFHQAFVPTRHPGLDDLMRDILGASTALLAVRVWQVKNGLVREKQAGNKIDIKE